MNFHDTKLLDHPEVRKAFNACAEYQELCEKSQKAKLQNMDDVINLSSFYFTPQQLTEHFNNAVSVGEALSLHMDEKNPNLIAATLALDCFFDMSMNGGLDLEKFKILSKLEDKTIDHVKELLNSTMTSDTQVTQENKNSASYVCAAMIAEIKKNPSVAQEVELQDETKISGIDTGLFNTLKTLIKPPQS